jgi:hypothetical protein
MNGNKMNSQIDEFYIGYSKTIPKKIRKFLLIVIPSLVGFMIILGIIFPLIHNQFTTGKYTGFQEFEGLLVEQPIPHLVVPRPGKKDAENGYSRYILAATSKRSVSPQVLELAGNWVKLRAIPVFRDNLTLLAVSSKTPPEILEPPSPENLMPPEGKSLGNYTLTGEIVDTKCYLGVMNPGHTKTHRECAIRCISGGVPPTLRVENQAGDIIYFLLVNSQGNSLNPHILDIVGDPVQITGEVVKYGDLLVLTGMPEKI